jgi:hypothetical protein
MAIKPNDCVIRLKDLEIGTETIYYSGKNVEVPVYEPYWKNFLDHISAKTDISGYWYDPHDFEGQLAKFNATYKNTKNWDDRYIKFKSHKDLTFFVLRWS